MNKQQEPRLRFKGFTGEWEEKVLGENASFTKGSGYSKSDLTDSGFPIILYGRLYTKYENIIENVDTFVSCDKNALKSLGNEVIVPASGETAEDIARASAVYQQDVILGGDLNIITPNENIASPFLALTLTNGKSNQELAKKAQGKSVVHLRNDDLRACKISFPSFLEQTHLGLFFRRLDSQIAESRAVLEKSRQLKKAMLAKMFPANGEKIPKIRFKGFEGEWERKKLGEIAFKVKEKNIAYQYAETFTNSAEFGIISQQDFFDKSISNSENIGGYYVVQPNDFVYNPRISSFAPVGPIKRNKLGRTGVMSPLYYVFRLNDEIKPSYLEQYFEGNQWHHFMYLNGDTGARSDRFSIKNDVFAEMPISFPTDKNEQTAIGNFFRQLDETIALQTAEVEKLNQLKKGLLAAMLV